MQFMQVHRGKLSLGRKEGKAAEEVWLAFLKENLKVFLGRIIANLPWDNLNSFSYQTVCCLFVFFSSLAAAQF